MGYDREDVEVAATMMLRKTFPYTIHGRTYQTEEELYNDAIHEFFNEDMNNLCYSTLLNPLFMTRKNSDVGLDTNLSLIS